MSKILTLKLYADTIMKNYNEGVQGVDIHDSDWYILRFVYQFPHVFDETMLKYLKDNFSCYLGGLYEKEDD